MSERQIRSLGIEREGQAYIFLYGEGDPADGHVRLQTLYLARKVADYDIVVSCQNVADIYPALERAHLRPALIEHGGLVSEALAGPKHLTARYVGVCATIWEAAASRMAGCEHHALEIPSMVDLAAFRPGDRATIRAELGLADDIPLIGWVGRLDSKKRVEDFIEAAAIVHRQRPNAQFVIVGGPDAFMPEYAESLKALAERRQLSGHLRFLGDSKDVPALLASFDLFSWLSRGEGMPHVITEAGAASLPIIATPDNGALQQIEDGVSGLLVPHENPAAVAAAMVRLIDDPALRQNLGAAMRRSVEARYSVAAVVPQWEALVDAVLRERQPAAAPKVFRSYWQGGFECSTHQLGNGRRLDIIASSEHDRHAQADYRQLGDLGMRTVRDGFRWHRIESQLGQFDWSSFRPGAGAMSAISIRSAAGGGSSSRCNWRGRRLPPCMPFVISSRAPGSSMPTRSSTWWQTLTAHRTPLRRRAIGWRSIRHGT